MTQTPKNQSDLLPDCSGCTDGNSEGTYAGCTRQHGHVGHEAEKCPYQEAPKNQREVEELKEKLAAIEHERWADWQKYFFSKCDYECEGEKCFLTLPSILLMRWQRQIDTPYVDLSEKEKDSDRKEVARYWPLIEAELKTI